MAYPNDGQTTVPENAPETVATPEGDNEYAPDQPLPGASAPLPERPRGNEPHTTLPLADALPK